MKNLSRRDFLGLSLLAGAALATAPGFLNQKTFAAGKPKKMPLGFQVWTIKDQLITDFPGTLKMMAGLGYQAVEMCSPPGYESSGFGPLMKLKAKEMLKIINDAGLIFQSSHYGMGEFRNNLKERIEFAAESGQKQMVLSSFWLPKGATMDDWMKAADELNEMGRKTKEAGIQMAFHNHHMEFEKIDGVLIYDELLKRFDPDLVKMQFQVAVVNIGYIAADYFRKYPGRFISAHLADWSATEKKSVPLGKGIVDWKEFFSSVKEGGVQNVFVEMDPVTFEESAKFYSSI
ncbi:MAG TPA: sugar phosphate isomerase/epimerase [Prolixibacteraceae bacterium]|nr:sugar phosphate isomerase/epimerase [Prolixibacteraceae bacterium]